MAKEWLSITEAAKVANVHRQTIWRGCDQELFETAVMVGETWMIEKDEIIKYGEHYHSTEFDKEVEGND